MAVVSLSVLGAVLSCDSPFDLASLLDGPSAEVLTISPATGTVVANQTVAFSAAGGVPPYEFSVVGGGTMNGNVYTAPATSGTATITVTDSIGETASAELTIDAGMINVGISPSFQSVFTGGTVQFSAFGGTGPFVFAIDVNETGATIDSGTGEYTAGTVDGTDTVSVTDTSAGTTATASVAVQRKPLSISPVAITVFTEQSVVFTPVGGDGPFTFAVSGGSGTPSIAGATYTAGSVPGIDIVTMTDAYDGRTRDAEVTVVPPTAVTNVDYAAGEITNVGGSFTTGDAFIAESVVTNVGTADGTADILWTVYASLDPVIGGMDYVVATGSEAGGLPAGDNAVINISGEWPLVAGEYYLLIAISAADDLDVGNNVNQSPVTFAVTAPVTISPTTAAVYTGQEIQFSATGPASRSFAITANNSGGSIDPATGLYMAGPNPGTDIVEVEADGITATATISVQAIPLPTAVDYEVTAVTRTGGGTTVGSFMTGEFTVRNIGTADGSYPINWTVYAALGTTVTGGSTIVDAGSTAAIVAGNDVSVPFTGNWPSDPGAYYLVVVVSAVDDTNTGNNSLATTDPTDITVPPEADVDYTVMVAPAGGSFEVNDPRNESFTITNDGTENGSATLTWTAYLSDSPNFNSADPIVGSGSIAGGLDASESAVRSVTGNWPGTSGVYYLIIRLNASDESNHSNNIVASQPYTVSDPAVVNYVPSDISRTFTTVTTGSPISETFSVANIGGLDGAEDITWTARASTSPEYDIGDVVVGTGQLAPLLGGAFQVGIPITGSWPAAPGQYYLVVDVQSPDDTGPVSYTVSAGTFTVNEPPDYRFDSVNFPVALYGGHPGDDFLDITGRHPGSGDHEFSIAEVAGAPGQHSIQWYLYLSEDQSINPSDTVVQQGILPPLAADATSERIEISPDTLLPAIPGRYYYILKLVAPDDANNTNDTYVIGPVDVWQSADPILNPSDTGARTEYDFFIRLNQGQTVNIQGNVNTIERSDTYVITTGPGVTELQVFLAWGTNADLDIIAYVRTPKVFIAESIDPVGNREPTAGTFDVPVTELTQYLIEAYSFSGPQLTGQYILTIEAAP
ncbi:MAG: hypothetical protein EA426_02870 [Spirochaetaceae bacterium]|nr:MAG: hypothetical protein EA426_02870 [Spirochaetaceae bacterium]